jgi:hypothetical protein
MGRMSRYSPALLPELLMGKNWDTSRENVSETAEPQPTAAQKNRFSGLQPYPTLCRFFAPTGQRDLRQTSEPTGCPVAVLGLVRKVWCLCTLLWFLRHSGGRRVGKRGQRHRKQRSAANISASRMHCPHPWPLDGWQLGTFFRGNLLFIFLVSTH